jgi:hypothetical protein
MIKRVDDHPLIACKFKVFIPYLQLFVIFYV